MSTVDNSRLFVYAIIHGDVVIIIRLLVSIFGKLCSMLSRVDSNRVPHLGNSIDSNRVPHLGNSIAVDCPFK